MTFRTRKGFTLIEMIAVLTLLLILGGLAVSSFRSPIDATKNNSYYLSAKAFVEEARTAAALDGNDAEAFTTTWGASFYGMCEPEDAPRVCYQFFGAPGARSSTGGLFQTFVIPLTDTFQPAVGQTSYCFYDDGFTASGGTYNKPWSAATFLNGTLSGKSFKVREAVVDANGHVPWRNGTGLHACTNGL